MPSSDHASGVLSREAKRLDSTPRHGTLAHAHLKVSFVSLASLLSSPISLDGLLGLDIESLSCIVRLFAPGTLCPTCYTTYAENEKTPFPRIGTLSSGHTWKT